MTCQECSGGRFEYLGTTPTGAVALRCTRCARTVEQAVAPLPAHLSAPPHRAVPPARGVLVTAGP